jgi:hypothetical protein
MILHVFHSREEFAACGTHDFPFPMHSFHVTVEEVLAFEHKETHGAGQFSLLSVVAIDVPLDIPAAEATDIADFNLMYLGLPFGL